MCAAIAASTNENGSCWRKRPFAVTNASAVNEWM
jgi:hypothetical protein